MSKEDRVRNKNRDEEARALAEIDSVSRAISLRYSALCSSVRNALREREFDEVYAQALLEKFLDGTYWAERVGLGYPEEEFE